MWGGGALCSAVEISTTRGRMGFGNVWEVGDASDAIGIVVPSKLLSEKGCGTYCLKDAERVREAPGVHEQQPAAQNLEPCCKATVLLRCFSRRW